MGILAGRVTDSAGGAMLKAQITVEPGHLAVLTNAEGIYSVTGLASGSYTVNIATNGFSSFSAHVTLASGEEKHLDAVLQVAAKNEMMVVHAEGVEAAALQRQRDADNILAVIPAEVITSLPNANVGDAIGRLPGVTVDRDAGEARYVQIRGTEPRLSNFTIDGVNTPSPEGSVRQVKLDVIPAELVDSIEVSKTLAANQDADAIGGSVNVKTKTAQERPTLTLSVMGGQTPLQGGRGVSQFAGTAGRRFGKQKRLGVLVSATYDYNGRGVDDLETTPTAFASGGALIPAYTGLDLRSYLYDRKRLGFGGSWTTNSARDRASTCVPCTPSSRSISISRPTRSAMLSAPMAP